MRVYLKDGYVTPNFPEINQGFKYCVVFQYAKKSKSNTSQRYAVFFRLCFKRSVMPGMSS